MKKVVICLIIMISIVISTLLIYQYYDNEVKKLEQKNLNLKQEINNVDKEINETNENNENYNLEINKLKEEVKDSLEEYQVWQEKEEKLKQALSS